jgi:two-component system, LuxR family, response regulator FixJ
MVNRELNASVFLVDDDDELRESLTDVIRLAGLSVESYASAESFRLQVDTQRAGCLVLDVRLPKVSGLELQRVLKESGACWPIIFLTGVADARVAVEAMKLGALDFLIKPVHEQSLLDCIDRAFEINAINRRSLQERRELQRNLSQLTEGELKVLELVTHGWLNKQIATALGVSLRTVENRRASILKKLQINSITELIWQIGRSRISMENIGPSTRDLPGQVKGPHFPVSLQSSEDHNPVAFRSF